MSVFFLFFVLIFWFCLNVELSILCFSRNIYYFTNNSTNFCKNFSQTGHLSVIEKESTGLLFDDLIVSMRKKAISFEYLPSNKIGKKFPNLKFGSNFEGYFEDNGAVLKANLCRKVLLVS